MLYKACNEPSSITQLDDLQPYLKGQFVILFGSAISGAMKPKLPMINDVTQTILSQMAARLHMGSWLDQVVAGYAKALVHGYHRVLLSRTKFENFIWRLQRSLGKENTDDLLARIYGCKKNQYNLNHSALAFLLKRRICLACLTTNFDNALELCLSDSKVYIHPHKPDHLPSAQQAPALIKLHGDAVTRTCVSTSPELSFAKTRALYAFLEDLLRDHVVVVLGYSGFGDIDISPHLGKYERLLLWGNYSIDKSSGTRHNQVDFVCNLSVTRPGKSDEKGRHNLLLELAASYGWKAPTIAIDNEMNWQEEVRLWTEQIPIDNLRDFITAFMSWRTSWPHVHIAYLGSQEDRSFRARLNYARATTQVAAYNSSERLLKVLLMATPPNLPTYVATVQLLGFTYWRQGRYQRALGLFLTLLRVQSLASQEWGAQLDTKSLQHIGSIARHYLEALIEMIYDHANNQKRRAIVQASEAAFVVDILKIIQEKSSSNYYLNQIAIQEIQFWLGERVSATNIREFFYECVAMEEWEAAAVTTQFLLTLSLSEGKKAVAELLPMLKHRGSKKLIIKVRGKMQYEATGHRIPLRFLNYRVLMRPKTAVTELILAAKKLSWKFDRIAKLNRVETGFFDLGDVSLGELSFTEWLAMHLRKLPFVN